MNKVKIAALIAILILCTLFVPRTEVFATDDVEVVNVIIDTSKSDTIIVINEAGLGSASVTFVGCEVKSRKINEMNGYTETTYSLETIGFCTISFKKITDFAVIQKIDGEAYSVIPGEILYSTFEDNRLEKIFLGEELDPAPTVIRPIETKIKVEDENKIPADLVFFGVLLVGGITGGIWFMGRTKRKLAKNAKVAESKTEHARKLAEIRRKENEELDKYIKSFDGDYVDYPEEHDYSNWIPEYVCRKEETKPDTDIHKETAEDAYKETAPTDTEPDNKDDDSLYENYVF